MVDPLLDLADSLDILIEEGRISHIAPRIEKEGAHLLEAGGKVVVPGLIDMHVHLRDFNESHKETIATGTKAADGWLYNRRLRAQYRSPPRYP